MYLNNVFVFAILIACGECIPDFFPSCKRSDPQIEDCFIKGVEEIKPKLSSGIPEISLPALDPLHLDQLAVDGAVAGATVKALMTNVNVFGGSDFNIKYLKLDLDNKYAADLEVVFPHLHMTAEYNTRGSKMLLFSINGRGKVKADISDVSVVAKCEAMPVEKEGVEYLQLDKVVTKVSIGKAEIDITPAEWSLSGSAASSFIRSSPSTVISVFSPLIDDVSASLVKKYLNDVLTTVPLKEVLLD